MNIRRRHLPPGRSLGPGLALAFILSATGQSASSKLLEFPGGLNHAFVEDGTNLSVRLHATILTNTPLPPGLDARVVDVEGPMGRPAGLLGAIGARLGGVTASGPLSLVVTSSDPARLRPGPYVVGIELTAPGTGAAKPSVLQTLTLTLRRDAPRLAAPQALVFTQTRIPGGLVAPSHLLAVREDGGTTSLPKITPVDEPDPPTTEDPGNGHLEFALTSPSIPAGSNSIISVTPNGKYALGRTTGRIRLTSEFLISPVLVNYTINARRHPGYILVWAVVGSVIGWVLRVFLQKRRSLNAAQAGVQEAGSLLKAAHAKIPDEVFRKEIEAARNDLAGAFGATEVESLQKAAQTALTQLADAQTRLTNRSAAVKAILGPLRDFLRSGWILPAATSPALGALRIRCVEVERLFEEGAISKAGERINAIDREEALNLVRATGHWRSSTAEYLRELRDHPPAIPEGGVQRLIDAIDAWLATYGTYADVVVAGPAEVQQALTTAHAAFDQLRTLAGWLRDHGTKLVDWVGRERGVSSTSPPGNQLWIAASSQSKGLLDDLKSGQPDATCPAARRQDQEAKWFKVLASLLGNQALEAGLKEALASGKWREAVKTVRDNLVKAAGAAAGQRFPPSTEVPSAAEGVLFGATQIPERGGTIGSLTDARPFVLGPEFDPERLRTEKWWIQLVQSAIVGVLFAAVAYKLFEPQWIGTVAQGFGVFAWAFFIDLSADSLLPQLKKAIPAGA